MNKNKLYFSTFNGFHRCWNELNRASKCSLDLFHITTIMGPKHSEKYIVGTKKYLDFKPLIEFPTTIALYFQDFATRLRNILGDFHGIPPNIVIGWALFHLEQSLRSPGL